ncbi:MAG TPA: RNase A-like domain-containing protein, partial [Pyrinomonadaceae bacterium]
NENIAKPGNGNGNAFGSKHNVSIPPEITQIVRTIKAQILTVLNNPQIKFNGNVRVTIQNSPELSNLIHGSKKVLLQNFGAKPFVNLNLHARMHITSELILRYLSKTQTNVLLNHSAKQILNGLLLARGFAVTADKFFPRHDIFSAKKFPLPYNVPPVVIRNLGNAVKSLIVEARLAQTPKDLEAAVEKFMRHLSGKNNLDALASAVKLAEQFGIKGNVEGEGEVPEKIAEMVKFLILAGDKALQSVADAFDAAEGELLTAQNADNSATPESSELERNYETIWSGDSSAEAEGALRRQLEFNPFFQNDCTASAFENPSEASRAQEEFSNRFQNEIQQWLESGNHRFVKDLELEKPIGIVVERGTSGFFMADSVRFVLVRDGSVQGWHFLKSFLVK